MNVKLLFAISCLLILSSSLVLDNEPKIPKSLKAIAKALDDNFAYVPSGNTIFEDKTLSIQSFFISKGEVTNNEYQLFLADLKATGQLDKLTVAQIDSSKWSSENWKNQGYVDYYANHPAYKDYPVVNISYEGAQLYCEWLTEQFDKKMGTEQKFQFRLPLRSEFIYACQGSKENHPYAWGGPYIRNKEGQLLCNHLQIGGEQVHLDKATGEYTIVTTTFYPLTNGAVDVTAPSKSYWPNEFGIYNLNGNVSEMINEKGKAVGGDWRSPGYDVRNESVKSYENASPNVGFRPVMTVLK